MHKARNIPVSQPSVTALKLAAICTFPGGYEFSANRMWRQAFDTLTHFIETCPYNVNAPSEFADITSAVAGLYGADGGSYRATYLSWLESLLYLNTSNPAYFCACVEEVANTLPLPPDTKPGNVSRWTNVGLSLIAWLIHNTTCDTPALAQQYDWSRQNQFEQWANNPGAYKLDTTLPTMQQLGLDSLLKKHFQYVSGVKPPVDRFDAIVPEFGVSENPFTKQTVLRFTMSEPAYLREEVFNLLDVIVQSDGGHILDPGEHSTTLDLTTAPSGTYYLRIMLGTGEVRTMKLVKE